MPYATGRRPGVVPTLTLSFLALLTDSLVAGQAHAATATVAGRTKGSFAVSPTGAATYTIPIWAPPGPQGMQPHIALTYNSRRGNGYLGIGWGLNGLSSIYRCNLTYAQDAAPGPVALATSDGYCMDGQRLRLTSGTYGTAGSTYQTETANFINVTAVGTAGNGPASFTAVDRNGRTYTYGSGGNSQVLASGSSTALSWQLSEVSDPYGNTMTVAYNPTSGTTACVAAANLPVGMAIPCTISWTPSSHGSSSYSYTMTFVYGSSVKPTHAEVAGTPQSNPALLDSISIAYSGTAVKTYYLTYQTSGTTGNEELTQVQECAGSGTSNCVSPTTIGYQSGASGVASSPTTLGYSAKYMHYDFNGDGYPDLLYVSGSYWYVAFGSASGYSAGVSTGIPSSAAQILPGGLLGTGSDGILAVSGSTWYYYSWNAASGSFSSASTGLTYDSTAAQYLLADVNGDGLPDLIASYYTTTTSPSWSATFTIDVHLNSGAGSSVSFGSAKQMFTETSAALVALPTLVSSTDNAGGLLQAIGSLRRFDFNGDGRDDLAMQTQTVAPPGCGGGPPPTHGPPPPASCNYSVNTLELLSGGSTTSPTFTPVQIYTGNYTYGTVLPVALLNFNSDACTDYLVAGSVYVSGCNGTVPSTIGLGTTSVIGAMDWNGDGLTDILVANGSTVGVYESTGNGVGTLIPTSIPYSASNVYFTFDANGDGQDDFGYTTSSGTYYYSHNSTGQPPDLVSSVTDGFSNSATPTYVSLVRGSYTASGFGTPTFPYQTFIAPLYVVNKAVFSDPSSSSGGTYNQTFSYYAAWTNIQGRGFQAFYDVTSLDSRTGLTTGNEYQRTFPGSGMLIESYLQNASFNLLLGENTLTTTTLSSTSYEQRYFPYFSNQTLYNREINGTENGDLITTTSVNYTYDNYGTPTLITRTVTDNDPNSPYTGDAWTTTITNTPDESTSPWCLALLSKSVTAYSGGPSGTTPVTLTKTFTPDTTHCDYTQSVTQPSTSYTVTEALGYDSFGNVNSDAVTGYGMAARTTTANWGTTGQFPMSVTDPTNATTQFNYNFSYGEKSSTTDPNNLATSWQYDNFGRQNQVTHPDGTYDTWTYVNCSGTTGCLMGTPALVISHYLYNKDNSLQSYGAAFLDSVDRTLVTYQIMPNGSGSFYARNELRYDSLGRVSQRAFPCTYTSLTATCPYWTTLTYDVVNRVTESQRPISSTNSTLQSTNYAYAGRTTTVTDALTNAWTSIADVNGLMRQTKDPYAYAITVSYDAAGNKTGVSDSNGKTLWSATYNYGIQAFPATVSDIDMGGWSFTFDALGEKTAWKDAKSQSFSMTFDAISRPLTRTEPDLFTQWTYGSSASSHNIGKLQSVCTGIGTSPTNCASSPGYAESETYDSDGRQSTRSITVPGQTETFTYTWQYSATTGLLNTLTYPASYPSTYQLQLQYAWSYSLLQSVTNISDTPNVTVWQQNAMDPMGHVTEETLGNGIVTNRSFDAVTGWLGSAQSGVGGGSGVKNLGFLYDLLGDVTQRQDNNLGLTENVYYDNDYRFSYSKLNGTQNLSVSYATNGNITSRTDVASGASWTYSPTQIHAVTQAGSSSYLYAYDANGNATSRQGSALTWASYNYPTAISAGSGSTAESVALAYGPDRSRWQQAYTGNGTTETTDYLGGLFELVASGGTINYRHYVYAGNEPVAVYSRTSAGVNTFSYLLFDHQASVASITNSSGAQVLAESFTPFGNRRNPTTWSGAASNSDLTTAAAITRQGYTFQTQLGLWMGLNHMNGRVEDSITGRFLSADPFIPVASGTQEYNRYSYADNNPLSLVDPTGFDSSCAGGDTDCLPENGPGDYANQAGNGPPGAYGDLNYSSDFGTVAWGPASNMTTQQSGVETLSLDGQTYQQVSQTFIFSGNTLLGHFINDTGQWEPCDDPGCGDGNIVDPGSFDNRFDIGGPNGNGEPAPFHPSPGTQSRPTSNKPQGDQLPEVTVTATKCTSSSANESFGDQVSDAIVGFGDAFLIPILVRNVLDINGSVNYNSSAYNGGMIGGTIWGLVPFALEGAATYSAAQAARGTPSILNANPYFRIGPGRWGGNMVPRVSSPYLPGDGHISLSTRLPPIPPLGALAPSGGC
jgi:RHS repeat-associated protein